MAHRKGHLIGGFLLVVVTSMVAPNARAVHAYGFDIGREEDVAARAHVTTLRPIEPRAIDPVRFEPTYEGRLAAREFTIEGKLTSYENPDETTGDESARAIAELMRKIAENLCYLEAMLATQEGLNALQQTMNDSGIPGPLRGLPIDILKHLATNALQRAYGPSALIEQLTDFVTDDIVVDNGGSPATLPSTQTQQQVVLDYLSWQAFNTACGRVMATR